MLTATRAPLSVELLTVAPRRPRPVRTPVPRQEEGQTASVPAPPMPTLVPRLRRLQDASQARRRARTTATRWSILSPATAIVPQPARPRTTTATTAATWAAAGPGWIAAPFPATRVGIPRRRISARRLSHAWTPPQPAPLPAWLPAGIPIVRVPARSSRTPASPADRPHRSSTNTLSPASISLTVPQQ